MSDVIKQHVDTSNLTPLNSVMPGVMSGMGITFLDSAIR
ncbi:hypothetical protein XF_0014 [Xylella fastidiosa 9a5c]|uniref:Uncharacterized protein n=1 Tax=Xylella fastidiosa (strain 9a5c) TaxID=160492 RepID=Q9PHD0_XYLFA|nr:hypothetical protein XF_0014 [Xylella fastidiosa 9a5c]